MKKIKELYTKLENSNKKKYIMLAIFLIVWGGVLAYTLPKYKSSLGMKSYGNDNDILEVYEVNENISIEEDVKLEKDTNSISIKFATYARKNKGNVYIKVTGATSNALYLSKEISVDDVLDNAFLTFGLNEKIDISKENKILINISSDSKEGEAVGVYYSPEDAFDESDFYINDKVFDGDLKVRFLTDNEALMKFNNTMITVTIIGFTLLVVVIALSSKKEIIFASMALVFGLIFMIIITPMSPPDEQTHYEYVYQLSNKLLGEKNHLLIDVEYQDYGDFAGHQNVSSAYESFEEKINEELHLKNKYEEILTDVDEATYTLCYIPQVIAVTLCRLLKVNMLKTFYAGRLLNLLFYVACVYVAIKKTPTYKSLFGILATTPIMIQQSASYSYDTFLNGLLLVVAAFFFNWLYKEDSVTNKEAIALLIVVLFLTPLKVVYSLFVLCFWFVKSDKFGSKKRKNIILGIISLPVIIQFVMLLAPSISKVFLNIIENASVASNDVKIAETISLNNNTVLVDYLRNAEKEKITIGYVTRNLGEIIELYYHTVRNCIKIWFYEALGRSLSGVSLITPLKYSHIFSYIVIAAALLKEKNQHSIIVRASFVLISIAIGLFVMTGMLLTWTSVGDDIVHGIQGRYFAPLLFFFLTIINNPKIHLPQALSKYLTFANLIMVFEVIVYVMSYTFVN